MKKFRINETDENKRLDQFLSDLYSDVSRSQIKRYIDNHSILVNGQPAKAGYSLNSEDEIQVDFEELLNEARSELKPNSDIPLDVIYEDEDIIVINKQAGLVVHPGAGNTDNTLVNALLAYDSDFAKQFTNTDRPGIVHRLDKETSGLLVVSKNEKAHAHLSKQFETRTAFRVYYTITWHKYEQPQGIIESYIGRHKQNPVMQSNFNNDHDGKYALSKYKVELEFPFLNLVRFKLETGRTHQIRVHSKKINHCVFGDNVYSGDDRQIKSIHVHYQKFAHQLLKYMPRQALHAYRLEFIHPSTEKPMMFESDLPKDMKRVIEKLKNKFPDYTDLQKEADV